MPRPPEPSEAIAQLCPKCGLCCNGVLFADVELQACDSGRRLRALGLKLQPKGKKLSFAQPCACWLGESCRIYSDRPAQCRAFACGILKRVQADKMTVKRGLEIIARSKEELRIIEELMRRIGNSDADLPLTRRYAIVMTEPLDLAGDRAVLKLRARLTEKMAKFMGRLDRWFRFTD